MSLRSVRKPHQKDLARKEKIVTAIQAFIKRHAVLIYYILTFAISWGGILIVVGPGGVPGTPEEVENAYPLVILVLLAGPSIAGILMTGLVHGRAGLGELLSRLLRWRVSMNWYAVALLAAPLTVMATLFTLSLFSPVFLPAIVTADDKAIPAADGDRGGAGGGLPGRAGLDGVRHTRTEAALRCPGHWVDRGLPMGHVAPPGDLLDERRCRRRALAGPVPALARRLVRRTAGVPGAYGVGLRPDREPPPGGAHACQSHL